MKQGLEVGRLGLNLIKALLWQKNSLESNDLKIAMEEQYLCITYQRCLDIVGMADSEAEMYPHKNFPSILGSKESFLVVQQAKEDTMVENFMDGFEKKPFVLGSLYMF